MKTAFSICIISNKIDEKLRQTVASYMDIGAEICIGFNSLNDSFSILSFKKQFPIVKVYELEWQGYGTTKNALNECASNDWILSVDADEQADTDLQSTLRNIEFLNLNTVYAINIKHYLGHRFVRFGAWGMGKRDFVRLFNKQEVHWNTASVHETLEIPTPISIQQLQGHLHHYTVDNAEQLALKSKHYAQLGAERKFKEGKGSYWIKPYLSCGITFLKEMVLKLGFLDGKTGFLIASANAKYSFKKYQILLDLQQSK